MAEGPRVKAQSAPVTNSQRERYEAPRTTVSRSRPNRNTEGGLTEAQRRTVRAEEEAIKSNRYETAVIVNPNGDVLGRARGTSDRVSGADIVRAAGGVNNLKDAVLIHNHPGKEQQKAFGDTLATRIGSPLSGADLRYAALADMAEVRAVTSNYIYSVRRPAGGWNRNTNVLEVLTRLTNAAGRARANQLYGFVNSDNSTALGRQRNARAELISQWETIQAMARAMGTTITRRRR